MNINLSDSLIKRILGCLWISGNHILWNDLKDVIDSSKSKEIDYKNYGNKIYGNSAHTLTLDDLTDYIEEIQDKRKTDANYKKLKRDERGHFLPKYRKLKRFGYHSVASNTIKIRTIEPTEINDEYIIGRDTEDYNTLKRFRKDRIVGKIQNLKEIIY